MYKSKTSLFIIGAILLCLLSAIGTYFIFVSTGNIKTDTTNITVKLNDESFTYDGKAHLPSGFDIIDGSLNDGHIVKISYDSDLINAGEYELYATARIEDSNGYDVTSQYKIKVEAAKVNIAKKHLKLKAKDLTKPYDGTPLVGNDYEIVEGTLVNGHQIAPSYEEKTAINVGEDVNYSLTASIFDHVGNDVSSNYNIEYFGGMLNISKSPVVIRSKSHEKVYDGTPLEASEFELISGNVKEENITVKYSDSSYLTNVTDTLVDAKIESATIIVDGVDITNNYELIFQNVGKLKITPFNINVKVEDKSFVYNGEYQEYDDFVIQDESVNFTIDNVTEERSFFINDNKYIINVSNSTRIKNVSSRLNQLDYKILLNGYDVTSCFNISSNNATISITSKPILVEGLSEEFKYDGMEKSTLDKDDIRDSLSQESLLEGHKLRVEYNPNSKIDSVGTIDNEILRVNIIDENNEDVSKNYSITTINGKLTINKRPIIVTGESFNVTYDGQYHKSADTNDGIRDADDSAIIVTQEDKEIVSDLVSGDKITIKYNTSVKDYSETTITNEFSVKEIRNAAGVDVTNNYSISIQYGTINVIKKRINVNVENYTTVFDGKDVSIDNIKVTSSDISDDAIISIVSNDKLYTVNEMISNQALDKYYKEFNITGYLVKRNGVDITNNYDIVNTNTETSTKVKIVVNSLDLTMISKNLTKPFDGTPLTIYEGNKLYFDVEPSAITPIPSSLRMNINYANLGIQSSVNYGDSVELDIHNSISYSSLDGSDVSSMINLTFIAGQAYITKADITVVTASYATVYKNNLTTEEINEAYENIHKYESTWRSSDGKEISEFGTITENWTYNPTTNNVLDNFGVYKNTATFESEYFNITVIPGIITVKEQSIEIIIPEETAISYTSIENVNSYLNSTELGILFNLKAELSTDDYNALNFNLALDTTTIKPNESYSVKLTYDENEIDKLANYHVTYVQGKIKILEPKVKITIPSATAVFNGVNASTKYYNTFKNKAVAKNLDDWTIELLEKNEYLDETLIKTYVKTILFNDKNNFVFSRVNMRNEIIEDTTNWYAEDYNISLTNDYDFDYVVDSTLSITKLDYTVSVYARQLSDSYSKMILADYLTEGISIDYIVGDSEITNIYDEILQEFIDTGYIVRYIDSYNEFDNPDQIIYAGNHNLSFKYDLAEYNKTTEKYKIYNSLNVNIIPYPFDIAKLEVVIRIEDFSRDYGVSDYESYVANDSNYLDILTIDSDNEELFVEDFVENSNFILDFNCDITDSNLQAGNYYSYLVLGDFNESNVSSSYMLTVYNGDYEVIALDIEVEASAQVYTYSGSEVAFDNSDFTVTGYDSFNTSALSLEAAEYINAGVYGITLVINDSEYLKNFNVTYVGNTLTIEKLDIEVEASAQVYTYSGSIVAFDNSDFTVTGYASFNTSALSLEAAEYINAGVYGITLVVNDSEYLKNFNVTYVGNTLTIEKLDIEVEASAQVYTYSGSIVAFDNSDFTLTGYDSFNTSALSLEAADYINAGVYGITLVINDSEYLKNFNVTYVGNTLTIEKQSINITLDNQTVADINDFNSSIIIEGYELILVYSSSSVSNIYSIGIDYESNDDFFRNYNLNYIPGLLIVTG